MAKMRAVQVPRPRSPLKLVEVDVPEPTAGTVRIKVEACGVCHSETLVVEGLMPGIEYPRIPGHEVMGTIDTVGPGVADLKPGLRVGVGWHGGYDGTCEACRRGDFFACRLNRVTGIAYDGGYAEYMIARAEALALVPDEMDLTGSAPLMCAGVTTFNALRSSGAQPGDRVAVFGVGGLGHLALQYAAKMGFSPIAIARGKDYEPLARELGASMYIDSLARDAAAELAKLGGAKVILATVPSGKAASALQSGLGAHGKLVVIGVGSDPIEANAAILIAGKRSIEGWYSGTSIDSQDTLAFSQREKVRSMNELFPLERAPEAYERMMASKVRFRAVLSMRRA
jgi:D-arabinose 1-dehydrogenase-like Zn-dependent alcohol dehydrogenase